ncbi:MAG: T9SS type A sorting domain-containing protein [Bacteroidia bacterium]
MKKLTFALVLLSLKLSAQPLIISSTGVPYYENFDSMALTGTSSRMPQGYLFFETGNAANAIYTANPGSANTGDTYSFGVANNTDRAMGSLASGALRSNIGGYFVNATTGFITAVQLAFTMEQWRAGGRTSIDSSEFFYGVNTAGLNPARGTWIKQSNLNLISKVLGGTARALVGNDTANQIRYNQQIDNLLLAPGDTLYIRWSDVDVTGSDDGLSIDSLTIVFYSVGTSPPQNVLNFILNQTSANTLTASWQKPSLYVNDSFTTLVFAKQGSTVNIGSNNKFSLNIFNANTTFGLGSAWPNDTAAKCVYKGDLTSVNVDGLQPLTSYSFFVVSVREFDTSYSTGISSTITLTSGVVPPLPLSSLTTSTLGSNSIRINMTRNSSYDANTMTTLVFVKPSTSVVQGNPLANPNKYIANNNFTLAVSRFENDSLARCVMNSDSLSVTVNGLNGSTTYHILAYVVRNADSAYSVGATGNATTLSAPLDSVTNIIVSPLTSTTARVSWIKPTGYVNARYTTLVFAKPDAPILPGSATLSPARYNANANVSGNGTRFFADTAARCVFKGDTNFVNLSGLVPFKKYYFVIQVVNDIDSVYSLPNYASGSGLGLPPHYPIGPCVKTNTTTGLPDSNNVRVTFYGIVYEPNQRTIGLQFVLMDATGGITVLSNTQNFGYTVKNGDSIMISGTVQSNRGLAVLNNPDSLRFISSGNNLKLPIEFLKPNEEAENKLILIKNLKFITPPTNGIWPTNNSVVNALSPLNDTILIRVPNTSELAGKPVPTVTYFDIIGFGSQTSSSFNAPFAFNGYQILPRFETDIIANPDGDTLRPFSLLSPPDNVSQTIAGDTNNALAFSWNEAKKSKNYPGTVAYRFQIDLSTGNFSNPKINDLSNLNGTDTSYFISFQQLYNRLNLVNGQTLQTRWRVVAKLGNYERVSTQTYNMPLVAGTLTIGLDKKLSNNTFVIYPNPANTVINVAGDFTVNNLLMFDISGKLIKQSNQNNIDVSDLKNGIYFLEIQTPFGSSKQKITIAH